MYSTLFNCSTQEGDRILSWLIVIVVHLSSPNFHWDCRIDKDIQTIQINSSLLFYIYFFLIAGKTKYISKLDNGTIKGDLQ